MCSGWTFDASRCYLLLTERSSWNEAERRCQAHGAHLTSIESREHLSYLWRLTSQQHFWTGN